MNGNRTGLVLVLVILVAGCSTVQMNDTTNGDVSLQGTVVADDEVPENATVVSATDDRIADVEPLQELLDAATNDSAGRATRELSSDERERVEGSLDELPKYEDSSSPNGYFVRHGDAVVRVNFVYEE